jgi:hypothetical protein
MNDIDDPKRTSPRLDLRFLFVYDVGALPLWIRLSGLASEDSNLCNLVALI